MNLNQKLIRARALWMLVTTKIIHVIKVRVLKLQKFMPIRADYLENPMLRYPRNLPCWCGSKKKAKRCCLPKQFAVIPADLAIRLNAYMQYFESDECDK